MRRRGSSRRKRSKDERSVGGGEVPV